jgi:nucleoside 2-deoxyribosyltransferase
MTLYYAHSMNLYNTPQEKRDHELIKSMGFKLFCPNCKEVDAKVKAFIGGYDNIMSVFEPFIDKCDGLIFRAMPDGKIGSGVVYEIKYAISNNKPVLELPTIIETRYLSITDTKAYLRYLGQR